MNKLTHKAFGAQILEVCLLGKDLLYLSPTSQISPNRPLRGGIPILFPQFGDTGSLSKHGFVRDSYWSVIHEYITEYNSYVEYNLDIKKGLIVDWNHSANLNLKAIIKNNKLSVCLKITNTGENSFEFTGGLHPYFKIKSRDSVIISGLDSSIFKDTFPEVAFDLLDNKLIERLYYCNNEILFFNGFNNYLLKSNGFENWMIWNPGKDAAGRIDDLPDNDWDKFICIEPVINKNPIVLNPKGDFEGEMVVELLF